MSDQAIRRPGIARPPSLRHPRIAATHLLVLGAVLPSLLLVGAAALSIGARRDAASAAAQSADTMRMRDDLQSLVARVVDAETAQRGFLLTRDPAFLGEYRAAIRDLPSLATLVREPVATPAQRPLLEALRTAMDARLASLAQAVDLVGGDRWADAQAQVRTGRGKALMVRVRDLASTIDQAASERLEQHEQELIERTARTTELDWLFVGMAAVTLAAVTILVRRLRAHESLIVVCAWSRTIEYQGAWLTFEDYMKQRFGITISHGMSPAEAARLMKELEALPVAPAGASGVEADSR
jgi:CHASE3 domain sensor protein